MDTIPWQTAITLPIGDIFIEFCIVYNAVIVTIIAVAADAIPGVFIASTKVLEFQLSLQTVQPALLT